MNEFMFLLPLFNFIKNLFNLFGEFILAYGDSISVCSLFISAIFMVALPFTAMVKLKVQENFEQSFAWFSICYEAERALWNETFQVRDVATFSKRKVSQDLLSSNPMKARRARRGFWGKDWGKAKKQLSPEQRLEIYKVALNK